MKQWESVDEILDFAILNEENAAKFYYDLAEKVDTPAMKDVFLSFAKEEEGHKAKLDHLVLAHNGPGDVVGDPLCSLFDIHSHSL